MTRNANGTWEISHRTLIVFGFILPLCGALFSAGVNWAAVRASLDSKVSRYEYVAGRDTTARLLAQHIEQNGLVLQRLFLQDSLLLDRSFENRARLRIICERLQAGCQ